MLSSILPIAGNGERRNRASRSRAGSKPGVTSGTLGFWMRNWFTQDQVSVPDTQNTPEMFLYSPGHHPGHGTGWISTWQDDTRVWDMLENRNTGTGASPAKMKWDQ